MANYVCSIVILLLAQLTAATAQTTNFFQPQEVACAGVKRAFYSTELEVAEDPCDLSCSFNPRTGSLQAQCRYDYCEACSAGDDSCGVRVVQIDTVVSQEALDRFAAGAGDLDLGTQRKFCIDYTQGPLVGSDMTCIVVDVSFPFNVCDTTTLPHGLPLLACSESGCQCASDDAQVDHASPYGGFSTLDFDSCYGGSAVGISKVPDVVSNAGSGSMSALFVSTVATGVVALMS